MKKLTRSRSSRMLFGVCGGIAEYFNIDPTFVRLGFVICGFWGFGILGYIVLWLITPDQPQP